LPPDLSSWIGQAAAEPPFPEYPRPMPNG
jgi:hypothetical protein